MPARTQEAEYMVCLGLAVKKFSPAKFSIASWAYVIRLAKIFSGGGKVLIPYGFKFCAVAKKSRAPYGIEALFYVLPCGGEFIRGSY